VLWGGVGANDGGTARDYGVEGSGEAGEETNDAVD
jgi:hypothetical protein